MILPVRQSHHAAPVTPVALAPDFYQAAVPIVPIAALSRRIAVLQRRYKELRGFSSHLATERVESGYNDEASRIRHELIALLNQRDYILRVAPAQ